MPSALKAASPTDVNHSKESPPSSSRSEEDNLSPSQHNARDYKGNVSVCTGFARHQISWQTDDNDHHCSRPKGTQLHPTPPSLTPTFRTLSSTLHYPEHPEHPEHPPRDQPQRSRVLPGHGVFSVNQESFCVAV
ncbi:unnamed protein product [Arctogadus glacialis]